MLKKFVYLNLWSLFICFSVDDPDFKAGVASLALLLQVPPYHDHLEQLKVKHCKKFQLLALSDAVSLGPSHEAYKAGHHSNGVSLVGQ